MKTSRPQLLKKAGMFLPFCLFTSLPLTAQTTFTQRVQQTAKGEGVVTIHHSKEIDDLVNAAPAATPKKTEPATPAPKPQKEKTAEKPAAQTTTTPTQEKDTTEVAVSTSYRTRKVMGYRVQAYAGGNTRSDRQKAEQTANAIRALFPTEAVYTHFYNPRWICRVGNYPTYEEARHMLSELRKLGYSSATIVKGKITVPY